MQKKRNPNIQYDKAYKWIFTYFLNEAIEFLHPTLFTLIDWDTDWVMYEQELANIANTDKKLYTKLDKLIEFTLLDKKRVLILFHIEIQHTNPKKIAKRMYNYYTNIA